MLHCHNTVTQLHIDNALKILLVFGKLYITGMGLHEGTHLVNITPANFILVNCSEMEEAYINDEQKTILHILSHRVFHQDIELLKKKLYPSVYLYQFKLIPNIAIWLTKQNLKEINVRGEEVP